MSQGGPVGTQAVIDLLLNQMRLTPDEARRACDAAGNWLRKETKRDA